MWKEKGNQMDQGNLQRLRHRTKQMVAATQDRANWRITVREGVLKEEGRKEEKAGRKSGLMKRQAAGEDLVGVTEWKCRLWKVLQKKNRITRTQTTKIGCVSNQ